MKNFYSAFISKLKTKLGPNYFKRNTIFSSSRNENIHGSSPKYYRQFFMFPLIFLPKIAFSEEEEKQSDKLEMKEIVKGEYENRIRTFASIEKRFLVFSKVKKMGDYKMTYHQFLDSLIPFHYIKTKSVDNMEKFLENNETFHTLIKYIDVNNDNFINFEEYVCLSILMSIPFKKFKEISKDGKITRSEFTDLLMDEIKKEGSLKITSQSLIDGRIIKTDELKLRQCIMDFFTKAFKNETKISIDKDLKLLKHKIYLMLTLYEFFQLPQSGDKKISMEDFAKVLVSYVNIYRGKIMLSKIEQKKIPLEGDVTFDQFFCFFWFFINVFNEKQEIFKDNKLCLEDLKKLFKERIKLLPDLGVKINKNISDQQLKVMIQLFDENGKIFIIYKFF
jgi:hypothetical protein